MPPSARIGSLLLVVFCTFAADGPVAAQVLIPEPNDGPMTGVTRTWLDASHRAAPSAKEAAESPLAGPVGSLGETAPPVPPFEAPADRPGAAVPSRTTVDPHVAPATRFESRDEPAAVPEGSNKEPKLLQSSNAIELPRPEKSNDSTAGGPGSPGTEGSGVSTWITVGSSLAVVLGLFFVFAWIVRRSGGRSMRELPKEAVEVLGRAPLAGRQQIHLIRCGNKIVLVAVSPEHAEPLAEITEPLEVDRLTGLCRRALPGSASVAFQKAFRDLEKSSA